MKVVKRVLEETILFDSQEEAKAFYEKIKEDPEYILPLSGGQCIDEETGDWKEYRIARKKDIQFAIDKLNEEKAGMKNKRNQVINMTDEISDKLSKILHDKDISQRELAQKTGITEQSICRYTKGTRVPRVTE